MSFDEKEVLLKPFVYWAQRDDRVLLKVALKNLQNKEISVEGKTLTLKASAEGQNGRRDYSLELDLFSEIKSDWCHTERSSFVDFALFKETSVWWPKLLDNGPTPPWLKVDFDRWVDESEEEEEVEGGTDSGGAAFDPKEADREMFRRWAEDTRTKESERIYTNNKWKDRHSPEEELQMMVLFFYNLLQLGVTSFLLGSIAWKGAFTKDLNFFALTYSTYHVPLKISTLFTLTEVIFAAVKWTPGGVINPFLQFCGRSIALVIVTFGDPVAQQQLSFFHLMFTWMLADVIRFSYFMLLSTDRQFHYLTWLRYTMWMPLYPLGFGMEVVNICNCVPYYVKKAAIDGVPYHILIYIYLPIAAFGFLKLYFHMFKVRRKKLGASYLGDPYPCPVPSTDSNAESKKMQ